MLWTVIHVRRIMRGFIQPKFHGKFLICNLFFLRSLKTLLLVSIMKYQHDLYLFHIATDHIPELLKWLDFIREMCFRRASARHHRLLRLPKVRFTLENIVTSHPAEIEWPRQRMFGPLYSENIEILTSGFSLVGRIRLPLRIYRDSQSISWRFEAIWLNIAVREVHAFQMLTFSYNLSDM